MRKLGISLLIISISDNLIFNSLFCDDYQAFRFEMTQDNYVRKEQISKGCLQLYRILVSLFLSELEDQCNLIG